MKSTLKKSERIDYVSQADLIKFIEINSDIEWNFICDYVKGISLVNQDSERALWRREDAFNQDYTDDNNMSKLAKDIITGFFKAHPWIESAMFVFGD